MKGIVFTEFMEMVESRFSADLLDDVIAAADLPHGGAYTSVGTYDHAELVRMVVALSDKTQVPVPHLIKAFGAYLFGRFQALYPGFFQGVPDALTFLSGIENIIHAEVIKLYPDAQLPQFQCQRLGNGLEMLYLSPRHFEDLAHGLIEGAIAHWGGGLVVMREPLSSGAVRFWVAPEEGAG
jgi:Haem-NO-binding